MAFDPEPQDAQAFWRAAERAGIACRLFEGDTRFEGYGWYDALARLTDVAINIPEGGLTHPLDALRAPDRDSSDTATAPGRPQHARASRRNPHAPLYGALFLRR